MNQGNDQYREQMEVRLVALLMGEASEFEQAELRAAMEKDASLTAFYNEMKATLGLVQEASKKFTPEPANPAPPHLSPERREKLMAAFKVAKPVELSRKRSTTRIIVEWAAVAAVLVLLAGMLLPALGTAKSKSMRAEKLSIDGAPVLPQVAEAPVPTAHPLYVNTPPTARVSMPPQSDGPVSNAKVETRLAADSRNKVFLPSTKGVEVSNGQTDYGYWNSRVEDRLALNDLSMSAATDQQIAAHGAVPAQKPATTIPQGLAHAGVEKKSQESLFAGDPAIATSPSKQEQLYYRSYQVDTNTFVPALEAANRSIQRDLSSGGGGGGMGGGGMRGGGLAGAMDGSMGSGGRFAGGMVVNSGTISSAPGGLPSLGVPEQNAVITAPKITGDQPSLKAERSVDETAQLAINAPATASAKEVMRVPVSPMPATPPVASVVVAGQAPTSLPENVTLMGRAFTPNAAQDKLSKMDLESLSRRDDSDKKPDQTLHFYASVEKPAEPMTVAPTPPASGPKAGESRALGFELREDSRTELAKQKKLPEVGTALDSSMKQDKSLAQTREQQAVALQGQGRASTLIESEAVRRTETDMRQKGIVLEGKQLYDAGKYDEAEVKLKEAAKDGNRAAAYYLDLTKEARYANESKAREALAKSSIKEVSKAWAPQTSGKSQSGESKLAALEEKRDLIQKRIVSESLEVASGQVAPARPLSRPTSDQSFLGKVGKALTGTIETKIPIQVPPPELGMLNDSFDPYFQETEASFVKSEIVLKQAAKNLNLKSIWSAQSGRELSDDEVLRRLSKMVNVQSKPKGTMNLRVKASDAQEGSRIASGIAEAYSNFKNRTYSEGRQAAIHELNQKLAQTQNQISKLQHQETAQPPPAVTPVPDPPVRKASGPIPTPQPETSTAENAFSTFSLNVSDVTFKLAQASLQNNTLPDPASIRVEEFVNAFNYHDPAPLPGARLAFAWERAHYPFAHNRDVVRFGIQTAARGRDAQKPLNLVILLDNSGSMERPDRVAILKEALKVLANQLRPQDRISVIAFARTARLWVDGMPGGNPNEFLGKVLDLNPEGGTNLEDAMNLGYETAARHFMPQGVNRVIVLTDGAANLGNIDPDELKSKVIANRQKGIALDCYGIGWEGYNDDLLEVLSHNGDGRYGFLNTPEQAGPEFADQLAGALNVAAADVKTQVEFNPARVTSWRQIGYAKHQLTKEQFRDNTVDAAEIAAAEQGNALYVIEVNPQGTGPIGTVRVRFKVPETGEYIEQSWPLQYQPQVPELEKASPAMRLAVTASAFGEWLSTSPFATEVTPGRLQSYLTGVSETFAPDPRPGHLGAMIRQAQVLVGK